MTRSLYQIPYFELTCAPKHALPHHVSRGARRPRLLVVLRPETRDVATRVGSLAGVTYLRYTVLTSPNKGETAVHCCDPATSVLVKLVSQNPFSRSISLAVLFVFTFFQLIRSLVDPTLAALITCDPSQYLVKISNVANSSLNLAETKFYEVSLAPPCLL